MRVLVYPHELAIGGSQINAIDLAAGVAAAGHEVFVYGIPGPLTSYIEERGLKFIPARHLRYRPAPSRILQLANIAARQRIDLIHAYEWSACLDAYYGAALVMGTPLICTVLSMSLMPYVPPSVPLVMGTADLARKARQVQRAGVWVMEPPIDVDRDHPGIDGSDFRKSYGIANDELLIVSVSRLALDLKLDALVRAIDAANVLAGRHPIKLVLVGGGPAYNALAERAQSVNARWGREVILLTGPMHDPRTAYAAADVVIGMGSSALRALAIGRPVIVQGEDAFSLIFGPTTLDVFLQQGFYGLADGAVGATRLASQLEELLTDPHRRKMLSEYGRKIVVQRFSLARAVETQLNIYQHIIANKPRRNVVDAAHSAYRAFMLEVHNHHPLRKREQKIREQLMLSAARNGAWPPPSKLQPSPGGVS